MDDDTTRRSRRDDDPGATGPLWPPIDEDPLDPDEDLTRTRGARSSESRDATRSGADRFGRAPDLESTVVLSAAGQSRGPGADPTRMASDGSREWLAEPLPARPAPTRVRAGRPRGGRSGLSWPRIVAPIVLLAAIIAVVTLGVQAGVLDHGAATPSVSHPSVTTSPKAKAKYVYYHVKKGDTMSTIAGKYNLTLGQLLALNPHASTSTLAIGQKLKVPNPH